VSGEKEMSTKHDRQLDREIERLRLRLKDERKRENEIK